MNCPTCGYFLGQINIAYEDGKNRICNNPQLSSEDKEKELSKLLLSFKIRRYCCKMRLMSYKDIVKDILPITKDN